MKKTVAISIFLLITTICFGNIVVPDSVIVNYLNANSHKEPSWEKYLLAIIPPAISLLIGILTVIVSLRVTRLNIAAAKVNLDEQMQLQVENLNHQMTVQLATTVEKEWVEKVRIYLSEIIHYFLLIDSFINQINQSNMLIPAAENKVNFAAAEYYKMHSDNFRKNRILLSLYLNFNDSLEKELYDVTSNLWDKIVLKIDERHKADNDFRDIQRIAHAIFDKKLNGQL